MTKMHDKKSRKVKVGTILDEKVFQRLKERSAKEGRPIGSIIEDAVLEYEHSDVLSRELRVKALDELLSMGSGVSAEAWTAITDEDFYEQ